MRFKLKSSLKFQRIFILLNKVFSPLTVWEQRPDPDQKPVHLRLNLNYSIRWCFEHYWSRSPFSGSGTRWTHLTQFYGPGSFIVPVKAEEDPVSRFVVGDPLASSSTLSPLPSARLADTPRSLKLLSRVTHTLTTRSTCIRRDRLTWRGAFLKNAPASATTCSTRVVAILVWRPAAGATNQKRGETLVTRRSRKHVIHVGKLNLTIKVVFKKWNVCFLI